MGSEYDDPYANADEEIKKMYEDNERLRAEVERLKESLDACQGVNRGLLETMSKERMLKENHSLEEALRVATVRIEELEKELWVTRAETQLPRYEETQRDATHNQKHNAASADNEQTTGSEMPVDHDELSSDNINDAYGSLHFNLDTDEGNRLLRECLDAPKVMSAIDEYARWLRNKVKYGDDDAAEKLTEVWDEWFECFISRGLSVPGWE